MKHHSIVSRVMALLLVLAVLCSLAISGVSAAQSGQNRFNVVILLDASGSMAYTDPANLRYDAIRQFTNLLAQQGNVLGGVVFHTGSEAEAAPALIQDQAGKDAVTDMLESIPGNGAWTNIGAGLDRAVELLKTNGDPNLPSVIVFLSDGNTDMGSEEELQASLDLKAEAIQKAREAGISIYSVCLNANNTADVSEMEQISSATNGVFQEVTRPEDLQEVFNIFYNLIYGTSTIKLVDDVFPENGRLETTFDVPGLGVEEVNIIIYGNTTKLSLLRPDGSDSQASTMAADTFSMIKLTDVVPGTWTLITEGIPGDSIKINMVYNTNLGVDLTVNPSESATSEENVTITATLSGSNAATPVEDQYIGYNASLQVMDAYGTVLETLPMTVSTEGFQVQKVFQEGTYFFKVLISGNYMEKETEKVGPLNIHAPEVPAPPVNQAPKAVEDVVEATVKVWPFKGGSFTLDMKTLATDAEDSELVYQIISTSFMEGTDFTVDADYVLTMDNFSLSKGAYTITATDSGGLSCQIEVIVKAVNIGMIALLGMAGIALIVAAILGIGLYIALSKPFGGTISAQSYVNGMYRGTPKVPRRGRLKLASFGMDAVGLDYQKSYFQATGENFIYLVTDKPVHANGQKTNKVRIQSGAEVTVTVNDGDPRLLYIRFDSRMRGPRRRPAPGGRR